MTFLFSLLFLLGFAGVPIAGIILIIKKIRKKPVKKTLIVGAVLLVCFIVGVIGTPPAEPVDNTENVTEKNEEAISNSEGQDETEEDIVKTVIEEATETDKSEVTVSEPEKKEPEYVLSNLDEFACSLSVQTKMDDLKTLAKSHNLYIDYRNTGTGNREYRVALDKNVASTSKREKGSVIVLTFDLLHDDELKSVEYFDSDKMIEGFMSSSGKWTMLDYNKPEKPVPFAVASCQELVQYMPDIATEKNMLEELFCSVSASTTKQDIMDFLEKNGLTYNSRGAGNEEIIAYDSKVQDKFGLKGSYISVDFANDVLTHMEYCDYPVQYKDGVEASFFAKDYPYSDLEGFYITGYEKDAVEMKDADSAIKALWDMR